MKKIIGFTEPSVFTGDIVEMVENHYKCLPLKLCQNNQDDITEVLELIKETGGGVMLAGGVDIWPGTLGLQLERNDGLTKFDIDRDVRELFITHKCFELDIPMFLICRGFQLVLGAYYGLGLMQDISRYPILHSPASDDVKINEEKGEYLHWINVLPEFHDEFFDRGWIPSYHHQAVYFSRYKHNKKAENAITYEKLGIDVIGTADLNTDFSEKGKNKMDIIELARGINNRWIGTQGHPECKQDYLRNPASKIIVNKFAEMINVEV